MNIALIDVGCIVALIVVGTVVFELVGWLAERKARERFEKMTPRRALQLPERNAQEAALALRPPRRQSSEGDQEEGCEGVREECGGEGESEVAE